VSAGSSIESGLFAVVCAALDDRLRPVLDRLAVLEGRLAKLEPDDKGLTYAQAARMLGVSAKTVSRWVDAKKLAAGGGTPRSPRILQSEVHRLLQGSANASMQRTSSDASVDEGDMAALARAVLSSGGRSRRRV
jgi:excisionase family DNA binding protein